MIGILPGAILIAFIVQVAKGSSELISIVKQSFQNVGLCGLSFDKSQFNDHLTKTDKFPSDFMNSIVALRFHRSIEEYKCWAGFKRRCSFLAAMLSTKICALCIGLSENPSSYFNHLRVHLNSQSTPNSDSGKMIFDELFMKPYLMKEIFNEFATNFDLHNFTYLTIHSAIASSDLFLLRSNSSATVECDTFSLIKKIETDHLVDYVRLVSTFQLKFKPTESTLFDSFINSLSVKHIIDNRLTYLILFTSNNPLSMWIIYNYEKVIALKKEEFIEEYLGMLFNPSIYNYIFSLLNYYNTESKLKMREIDYSDDAHLNIQRVRVILLRTFTKYYPSIQPKYLIIECAILSRWIFDLERLINNFSSIFDPERRQGENLCSFLTYFVEAMCIPEFVIKRNQIKKSSFNLFEIFQIAKKYLFTSLMNSNIEEAKKQIYQDLGLISKIELNKEKIRSDLLESDFRLLVGTLKEGIKMLQAAMS